MNWKNAILALALILALGFLVWLLVEKSRSADLGRELARLRTASSQASDQLADAQRRSEQQSRQISEQEREIKQLRDNLAAAERNLNSARREAESLRRDLAYLREADDSAQAEIAKYRRASEAAAQELAASQSRVGELEKRLETAEAVPQANAEAGAQAAAEAQAESLALIADLEARLDQARAEAESLKKELAEQQPEPCPPAVSADPAENTAPAAPEPGPELEELQGKLEAGRAALEEARAEVERLKGELDRAIEAERETRARLTECQKDSAEQKALRDSEAAVLVDRLLFSSGSVTLSGAGMEVLEAAARVLNQSPDRAVLVVGHSDDQAPGRGLSRSYPSNWELSAARAAAVVRHLTEKGGVDPVRLSLVGRSHYQPQAPNANNEDRQKNRRVEIIISKHLPPVTEAP